MVDVSLEARAVQPLPSDNPYSQLILRRNASLVQQNKEWRLPTTYTEQIGQTAALINAFMVELRRYGGQTTVSEFLRNPYNLVWLEQMVKMDPKKVALAIQVNRSVARLGTENNFDKQFLPAINLGVYIALEAAQKTGLVDIASIDTVSELIRSSGKKDLWGERVLDRHLQEYLSLIPPHLTGVDRERALIEIIAKDIHHRLELHSQHAKILKQSQGIEVEVLHRLEYLPPDQRETDLSRRTMERVDRLGIAQWLPRGTKLEQLKRTDWRLVTLLGLREDVKESYIERFEMTTDPTVGSSAQSTILQELILGGFITEDILSDTWEKYSLHMSTTFPSAIWHERSRSQYVAYARALGGAFASKQRGIYGGYVWNDTVGDREVAEKARETNAYKPIAGQSEDSISGRSLVEIRLMDITERGHFSASIHKEYLDFGFRCYWQQQEGMPLENAAERKAANIWLNFQRDLALTYQQHGVSDEWWGVGWKKTEDPNLQTDLAKCIRKYSSLIRREVEQELQRPESLRPPDSQPARMIGKYRINVVSEQLTNPSEGLIHLSQDELTEIGLRPNDWVTLKFGERTVSVRIAVEDREQEDQNNLGISRNVKDLLLLPDNLDLSLRFDPMKCELAVGPLIGIIANVEDQSLNRPLGDQTRYYQRILTMAQANGQCAYVFDPNDVNIREGVITALTLSADGQRWERKRVPLPDLIFDRNFGAFPQQIREALNHIPWINNREFTLFLADKLELPTRLRENPRLRPYIPETINFTGDGDLERMLEKHRVVYLKPTWGMASYGVVRIEKTPDGQYRYNHTKPSKDPTDPAYYWPDKEDPDYDGYLANSIDEILEATKEFRSSYDEYIVQQGITMAQDNSGNLLDTRFLIQRGQSGKLEVLNWDEELLRKRYPGFSQIFGDRNASTIIHNARYLALAIALQTQASFGGNFGQMSVQIAIDEQGKPWLLEANPKPGVTNQFDAYNSPSLTDHTIDHLLGYSQAVSGYYDNPISLINLGRVELTDGSHGQVVEERNPFVIYKFVQQSLGKNMTDRVYSVYNLRSLEKIQENLAKSTRYLTIRDEEGRILGCITLLRPYGQWLLETEDPSKSFFTKPRWEIGGVLVDPTSRGKGIASKLIQVAIKELQKVGAEESIINVTGTFNPSQAGKSRADSIGIERIIRDHYNGRLFGIGWSYGPTYLINIPQAS